MKPVIRAVIDVGTNSVKLLVAEVAGGAVDPLCEQSHQTRLGHGFYDSHRLQAGPIANTAAAVAEFAALARARQAMAIRVIATSAAREAVNGDELAAAIQRACGLKLQIISGEQEAELVYQGVRTDPALAGEPLLLLEVGGGSTEIIIGDAGRTDFSESYQIGTVRLLEKLRPGDPPKPAELEACRAQIRLFLRQNAQPAIAAMQTPPSSDTRRPPTQLVGTGGTASILGCMEAQLDAFDRERLEATRLSQERLRWQVERLWSRSLEERRGITGLPKNRADVILTGAAIFEGVMELFGLRELRISTRGLRFAAVAQL